MERGYLLNSVFSFYVNLIKKIADMYRDENISNK
jgi:hypothetical protein